ncbi:TPA: DotI/IcmL/TraM family protein [Vibrio parahaemolyticus]
MFAKKDGENSPKQERIRQQAKKVQESANNAAKQGKTEKMLMLDSGVLEYVVLNQASRLRQSALLIKALLVMIAICLVIIFTKQNPPLPKDRFFGQQSDGGFTELKELSEPFTNITEMRNWAETCVLDSLELSFDQKLSRINKVLTRCYNQQGQAEYTRWLLVGSSSSKMKVANGSGFVEIHDDSEFAQIVRKKIRMSGSKISPARVKAIKPRIVDGESIARWEMQMPLVIAKYEGLSNPGTVRFISRIVLERTTDQSKEKGVAISSWTLVRGD